MEKRSHSEILNIVFAVLIIGAFAGGLALGHSMGKSSGYVPPAISGKPARGPCPFELSPEQAPTLAGLVCPGEKCEGRDVLKCHCQIAHGAKTMVKGMLAAGKSTSEARRAATEYFGSID